MPRLRELGLGLKKWFLSQIKASFKSQIGIYTIFSFRLGTFVIDHGRFFQQCFNFVEANKLVDSCWDHLSILF